MGPSKTRIMNKYKTLKNNLITKARNRENTKNCPDFFTYLGRLLLEIQAKPNKCPELGYQLNTINNPQFRSRPRSHNKLFLFQNISLLSCFRDILFCFKSSALPFCILYAVFCLLAVYHLNGFAAVRVAVTRLSV